MYSLQFKAPDIEGGEETFFFCSVGAWQRFTEWADTNPTLRKFASAGQFKNTNRLQDQIRTELIDNPPEDEGLATTIDMLLSHLGSGDPDEVVLVVDDVEDDDDVTDNVYCPTGPGGGVDPTCSPGGGGGRTYAPAAGLWGHQPTAVIRWMGKEGWNFKQAKHALGHSGVDVADATIRAQLLAGKKGERGAPADLTDEQKNHLQERRDRKEPPPKPDKPDPVIKLDPKPVEPPEPKPEPKRPKPPGDHQPPGGRTPPQGLSHPVKATEFTHKVWDKLEGINKGDHQQLKEVGKLIKEEVERRLPPPPSTEDIRAWVKEKDAIDAELRQIRYANLTTSEERDAYSAKWNRKVELDKLISPQAYGVKTPRQKEFGNKLVDVLSEVRQMGDPSQLKLITKSPKQREDAGHLENSTYRLPREWITDKMVEIDSKTKRGYHRDSGGMSNNITLCPGKYDKTSVATHELVHAAETKVPQLVHLQREWLQSRIGADERVKQISKGEFGYKDELPDHYCGRMYNHRGGGVSGGLRPGYVSEYGHYEVLSMGVEGLMHAKHGIDKDPDYVDFVIGCLAGI